jgi:FkbM family methyltransferase
MKKNPAVVGVHDFDWLYTQVHDDQTRVLIDWIIQVEKSYMDGKPMKVGTEFVQLQLGRNTVWTRENTTHSIPYGYTQIFKLLDEILPKQFREPMLGTILDIGANEGHWSMYMASKHPDASVIAFEPNPVPLELLEKNFASNKLSKVKVLPAAISDENGEMEFETLDNVTSLGSFKIDRTGRPWITDDKVRKISVLCRKLDDVGSVQGAVQIDLMKVDVEGAEVRVLKGAKETLHKTKRVEIEYGTNENRAEILGILKPYGFKLLLDHPYSEGRGDLFLVKTS